MFTSKANVEDFIWAIRQRIENIKTEEIKARATIFQARSKSLDAIFCEEKTKILASLVPDEVLQNVNDYSHKKYNACLLLGDVSGFTELSEKYNQAGRGGPSRLTVVLNGYIGALTQEIMSHGGDIFKFSGDAFLASWKCKDENQIMRAYIHQALDCALVIQKNYGTFKTDIGTYLRVKLAISAGPVLFRLIGNEKYSHYILIGKPILDVKQAENRSKAGQIVVAPSAWYHVNATDYISVELDGGFKEVVGVGASWRHIKGETKYSEGLSYMGDETYGSDFDQDIDMQKKNIEFALRPVMHQADPIKDSLRKFILPPVMSCIDNSEPIEYLTEMRRAVIMFINLTSKRTSFDHVAELVDECYLEICKNVEKFRGCVNKVSLFDKDIMFVVIFGLRGFKHNLECQYALQCGSVIFDSLNNHRYLKTVSIACTTGKTYCGIVGHTLRREYTVMSLIVNKAARIMVNYPDRVACDSSTFQHSKMEANHFILQVYKPLKGITNPGPIYEYQELDNTIAQQASVAVNFYPILGRDTEVQLYLRNLGVFVHYSNNTSDKLPPYVRMMIIRGWPRQGKTRLMEEFLFQTSRSIPVTKYSLFPNTTLVPFKNGREILFKILGFDENHSNKDIKFDLSTMLTHASKPYMCSLNEVFDIDFEVTEVYSKMSEREKNMALGKVVKSLCYHSIFSPIIISVDRTRFMDDSSWIILISMLACRHIFFVATLDVNTVLGPIGRQILTHRNVQVVELTDVHKQYHAGLACQILDVFAISADLENVLHKKSNGNPGWMEALLISLKQSHQIFTRNADFKTIHSFGLVAPPLYMMRRMSPENILKWKQIIEEKSSKPFSNYVDNWNIYIDICQDENVNTEIRGAIHQSLSNERLIPVCFLNPKFNFMDIDPELSLEGELVMTFDSLTYQEQLLLKCSSVLGDSFSRSLLVYAMQGEESSRETAVVVQSVFEKRVLCCAKGDFSEGGNYLLVREKMLDPRENTEIKCDCIGIYATDDLWDLPKYASCGYLRFISSNFRQTTYNLLTDSQKKMFHARAAKYLYRETKKCSSCGGAFFDLAGYCKVEELKSRPRYFARRKSTSSADYSDASLSISIFSGPGSEYTSSSPHSSSRKSNIMGVTGRSLGYGRTMGPSMGISLGHALTPSLLDDEEEGSYYAENFGILNPLKVLKLKDNYSLTKPFTRADFQNCHCHLILSYLYNQLIYHYRGSGQWLDMMNAWVTYVIICVDHRNYAEARQSVKEALEYLSMTGESLGVPAWHIPIFEAKLYTWYGQVLCSENQMQESLKILLIAMTKFGYPFPMNQFSIHINLYSRKLRQNFGMYLFPDKFIGKSMSEDDNDVVDNISCCLNKLFYVFMCMNKQKHAELAAVWSLTCALEAGTSLFQVCNAFANMILIAHYKKQKFWSTVLEVHALRFCHKKKFGVDPPELKVIIRLYFIIFVIRMARAEFDESLQMGYILTRLTVAMNDIGTTIKTFGKIIKILLIKMYLSECMSILQELSYHVFEWDTHAGKAEYYSCALMFHMETGYNFLPFKDIVKYYKAECMLKSGPEQMNFLMILRGWYTRTHQWEAAQIVDGQLGSFKQAKNYNDMMLRLNYCQQILYELEYNMMVLVHKINKRNIYDKQRIKEKISYLWKELDKKIDSVPIATPRYYVMKAYEAIIWNNESKMLKKLSIGKRHAVKQGNISTEKWITFLEEFWLDKLSEQDAQAWVTHSTPENYIEFNQLSNADTIMCYSLPVPLFY